MIKKVSVRKAYGEALADYGVVNSNVVVVVADVSASVQTEYFAKRFPERFFNVGIAEQGMVDTGVGLALGGMIPFVNTFAGLMLRAVEQIRTCVAYAKTNVKIIGGYAGLSDYKDGATHYSIMDIAIMRAMPYMVVIVPADAIEVKKMVPLVAEYNGPVYLRIGRAEIPLVFNDDHKVKIGKGIIVREGKDVTLIGSGVMVFRCLEATKILAKEGINTRVINMHTIKPLDISLVKQAADETGTIVTVEEHSIIGGLGDAVAEVLSKYIPVPLERVGIADTFAETALNPESLLDYYGMKVNDIVQAAYRALKRKKRGEKVEGCSEI
ncbi:MAG: transketolase family protein [Candidatus Atribacteria bacterium]